MSAKKTQSLTRVLISAFLTLGLSILIISGGIQIYLNFRTEKESISERQKLIAQQAANTVRSFVDEKFSILEAVTQLHDFHKASDVEIIKRDALLEKIIGLEPALRQLVVLDAQGRELIQVSRFSREVSIPVIDKFVTDVFGHIDLTQRYISSVYIDKITSEPMILISVPIKDVFRDFQGVLVAEVNLKFMWDLVGNLKIGEGGLAYVVNEEGNLIAFGDTSRVLKGENLFYLGEVKDSLGHKEDEPEIDLSVIATGINGNYVVSNHTHLGTPSWAVIVELPLLEAYYNVIQALLLSLGVILFSIVMVFVVSKRLSKNIAKPILQLRNIAREIGKGNLDIKAEVVSQNEIGELAATFNVMTSGLKEKISQLQEEHSRFLASINSLQLGFIAIDRSGNIIAINPSCLRILGLTDSNTNLDIISEKIGKEFDLRYHYQHCILERTHLDVKDIAYGAQFLRIFLAPINLSSGKQEVIGAVILIEDTTEQKVLERSKDEFFSIASHELRTPLTAIRGNASLIKDFYADKINDKEVLQMIDDMFVASQRLIQIVNDFLDVSRLEQKKTEFKKDKFDISELINETVKQLNGLIAGKGLTIEFKPVQLSIITDRERIRQVLINLINNSIQYTKQGGITLKIEKLNESIKISVQDTGVGIPIQNQSILFHKFQQAGDMLARDVTQGTGLGLYISRLIIESLGGTIALEESTVGKGSTFSFTLPIAGPPEHSSI